MRLTAESNPIKTSKPIPRNVLEGMAFRKLRLTMACSAMLSAFNQSVSKECMSGSVLQFLCQCFGLDAVAWTGGFKDDRLQWTQLTRP